jgi:hypothetical protein
MLTLVRKFFKCRINGIGRWVGKKTWIMWSTENSWPYRNSNSDLSVVQPVASHYIDWAIPVSQYSQWLLNIKLNVQWNCHSLIWDIIPKFSWRNRMKLRWTSVLIVGVLAEFRNSDFPNTSKKRFLLMQLGLFLDHATVNSGTWVATFWRNILAPSSGSILTP